MAIANEVDVALRDQIYYEAVKEHEGAENDKRNEALVAAILAVLLALGIKSFAGIPKSKVTAIITTVREVIIKTTGLNVAELLANMAEVTATVLLVQKTNLTALVAPKNPPVRITDKSFNGSVGGNLKLWKRIYGDVMPGTGTTPAELIRDLTRATANNVTRLIKQAFVEKLTLPELIDRVKGTAAKGFKDGLLNKLNNQWRTFINTMMANIKAWIANKIGPFFYDTYQWVSTIDAVTTNICRHRHLMIYRYGQGPVPPAHYNCRSVIVGMEGNLSNQTPATYWDWLTQQPARFLNDILTGADANAIVNGPRRQPPGFNGFRNVRRLSPAQYVARIPTMQSED